MTKTSESSQDGESESTSSIRYLSTDEVIRLHGVVRRHAKEHEQHDIEKVTGGVKDRGLLESAVRKPRTDVFGKERYETVFDKVGALAKGICTNHPFHNGNKRTALLSAVSFLRLNGYELVLAPAEEDFFKDSWGQLHDSAMALFQASPGLAQFAAAEMYSRGYLGFARILCDPEDDEVAWGTTMRARDALPVDWDWENDRMQPPDFESDRGFKDSVAELSEHLADFLTHIGMLHFTGQTRVNILGENESEVLAPRFQSWLSTLEPDERHIAVFGLQQPITISETENIGLVDRYDYVAEFVEENTNAEIHPVAKEDRYREILRRIDDARGTFSGLSAEITVGETEEDAETYAADFRMHLSPLQVDYVQHTAYFPVFIKVEFPDGSPNFDDASEEEISDLCREMEEAFQVLSDRVYDEYRELTEIIVNLADELGDDEAIDRYYSLPAPPLTATGQYERLWEFMERLVEEDLSIDYIADWFRMRCTPVTNEFGGLDELLP